MSPSARPSRANHLAHELPLSQVRTGGWKSPHAWLEDLGLLVFIALRGFEEGRILGRLTKSIHMFIQESGDESTDVTAKYMMPKAVVLGHPRDLLTPRCA